ncbi:MAG: ABC-F family ATP-binding cassette domain-containing protein [Lachnospiraceae bacterium]|nr:ABC-F family ATP-binding cassette domain-containing protein [Lachnospiraceae bacterium]
MIRVEKLSYEFPTKELYKNISFTLEEGQHCAFIGSNGTGKTTLVDMILDTEKYLYDGKIIKSEECRIGYVNQFSKSDKDQEKTVFEFLSEKFVENQEETARVCDEMATAEDLDSVFERYQKLLDLFQAMDGDNYESNIKKQLYLVGMENHENIEISKLSGGEYKLLQVVKEMLLMPNLLIMDEPDVFLDFENINNLCKLINSYQGTMLVITHNRYLLNHCFNKILHLENGDIQEFDGNFTEYNFALLQKKIELSEAAVADQEEIERTEKMVERMRKDATRVDIASLGRALNAKVTHLNRLRARAIKSPFVDLRLPKIQLPKVGAKDVILNLDAGDVMEVQENDLENNTENEAKTVLTISGYQVAFQETLLENVDLELHEGEKVAIVGANGTGKTTLLRDIYKNESDSIQIADDVEIGFLSQLHGEMLNEENTVYQEMEVLGFDRKAEIQNYLKDYCFEEETLTQKIGQLSGGEQNLLQLAKIALSNANLLLLDEPTSHLDTYSQIALEKALVEYKGAVLMVAHDFYHIVNVADSVLFVEDKTLRKMRIRTFRKMIYDKHFNKEYLELEQKKKELETRIASCLKNKDIEMAKELCEKLEEVITQMDQVVK